MTIEIPDNVIHHIEGNLKEFGDELPKNWNNTINHILTEYFGEQFGIDFEEIHQTNTK